ncbi:peptidase M23, partial [Micromonospora chalcea]
MRRLMLSCALAAIGAWATAPAPATAAPRPAPGPVADAVTAKLLGSADA